MLVIESSELYIVDSEFSRNTAVSEGGAVHVESTNNVAITSTVFSRNGNYIQSETGDYLPRAGGTLQGGAIYLTGFKQLIVKDITCSQNYAT